MGEWQQRFTPAQWAQCLAEESDLAQCQALRERTRNGWALGSVEFCEVLEKKIGQRVRPLPGRYAMTVEPALARRSGAGGG